MIEIIYNYSVTSTNDLAAKCETPWTIFIAEEQTKSRGQRGNSWESEPNKNLTFSLVMQFDFLNASQQFYISKIVSLAIVNTLEDMDIKPKIKWPNDIYVENEKICGILIENCLSSNGMLNKSIIGVGLNINQKIFKSDAPNPTSIINITGCESNRNEVLNSFALHLTKQYNLLSLYDYQIIDNQYTSYLYRFNKPHLFKTPDSEVFTAKIVDVLAQGDLIVEHENGENKRYLFKEIEYIL
ncbi:MAG: biotin--[acetyl-CoA-carboxylase] ligase [Rikenellaceae bacterium]